VYTKYESEKHGEGRDLGELDVEKIIADATKTSIKRHKLM
jgi:hypothetical protein